MTRKRKIERNTDSQIGYTVVRERERERENGRDSFLSFEVVQEAEKVFGLEYERSRKCLQNISKVV